MGISNWPCFDEKQIEAVVSTLRSGKINAWTGNQCKLFEEEFALFCRTKHAIAIANGSLALWAAYKAIGLKEKDEIITTPRTFIATSSSAIQLGAKPIFADIDRDSGSITVKNIEPLITKKTKAISVVHIGGWPAEMGPIQELARNYNLKLIEDCSQAHGASIKNKSVGTFSDISTWSFCQDKIISTGGEGGMITTSNDYFYDYIWSLKDHGKTLNAIHSIKKDMNFKWLHEEIGNNFRLTEMQSAIGRIQLSKLSKWQSIRESNANYLYNYLSEIKSIRIPMPPDFIKHAWYKFYIFIKPEMIKCDWDRNRILSEINQEGFPAFTGSCSEIYLEKCFKKYNLNPSKRLPVAKELGETSLMFLVDHTIDKISLEKYADVIKRILLKAIK